MAQEASVVTFGASPTYVDQLSRLRVVPRERFGLEALRTVNLAGSPASPECMAWFYLNVKEDLWVANGSGGTDCCTGFVGGVPTLPVRAGEIQAPSLGVSVKAYNARGESVVDEVGELVIDRKSTRLNSSHSQISYAVFCLKKKNIYNKPLLTYDYKSTL